MAFDQSVPNGTQTVGDAFASANANDVALKAAIDGHVADQDAHGLAAIRTSAADYAVHKNDTSNPHGIDTIRQAGVQTAAEVTAARGSAASLAARLTVALRNDGGLRLDAVSARYMWPGDNPSYASSFAFTVPGDKTDLYIPGALVRATVSGDFRYALVVSRSVAGGITTVNLDPTGPSITAGLSKIELGLISYDYAHAGAIAQLQSDLTALTSRVGALAPVRVTSSCESVPAASAVVFRFVADVAYLLPAAMVGSAIKADTAATASATFGIVKNSTQVGTVVFSAGGTVPTITLATDLALAAGDVLKLVAPAAPDATLKQIGFTIKVTPQ